MLNNIYVDGTNSYNTNNILCTSSSSGSYYITSYFYKVNDGEWSSSSGNMDMASVFEMSSVIDLSKGVHALKAGDTKSGATKKDEIETLYNTMMNNMLELSNGDASYYNYALAAMSKSSSNSAMGSSSYVFQTTIMKNIVGEEKWNSKYDDLLCIGEQYWLGGTYSSSGYLWSVLADGTVDGYAGKGKGVRPVVTLKSNIIITSLSGADGSSFDRAYTASIYTE